MSNLVIDIGNTFAKIAVFDKEQMVYFSKEQSFDGTLLKKLKTDFSIEKAIVSSVAAESAFPLNEFPDIAILIFSHQVNIPIKNAYKTPETLGLDRLAAVIGAKQLFVEEPVLVIDAGTCVTYDFINEKSAYHGGTIAPGLQMRLKAMHDFTGKLPFINWEGNFEQEYLHGENTTEAMLSGVINGILFEINGYIAHYAAKYPSLKIILCGGDASFFDTRLKNSIFAHQILLVPQLVLAGLNTVVNYQHDQN